MPWITMITAWYWPGIQVSLFSLPYWPLGEDRGISGKKVLTAYIVGFEIESKLGAGVNFRHYELGWHATCTLGTLGAAAACSSILGLDIEKTRMALGIAASEASGLRQNFGTMTKPFHAGLSARNGVIAALLAEKVLQQTKTSWRRNLVFAIYSVEKGNTIQKG